jgi:hypothetical protein
MPKRQESAEHRRTTLPMAVSGARRHRRRVRLMHARPSDVLRSR